MASVVSRGNGRKSIQFVDADGKRQEFRIGKATDTQANKICVHVNAILADKVAGRPHDMETLKWVNSLPKMQFQRAQAVGLVTGASRVYVSLGEFLDECMADILKKRKENTHIFYKNTQRNLIDYFGAHRRLSSIADQHAAEFREYLESCPKKRGKGIISRATVNRRIGAAHTFFELARKRKVIQQNPFEDVVAGEQVNKARLRYISEDVIAKVLGKCPDPQWYVMICLARFGGVRVPSEIVPLKWEHIDWENRRVLITFPKTEHLPGKETRTIPLFPELERAFLKLAVRLEPCGDGRDQYVIPRYRDPSANLGTQLKKIIGRAGVAPWPKPWHNLRASREKDLSGRFSLEVAAEWIGNSKRIALQHYLTTTDADFVAAVEYQSTLSKTPQNPPQQPELIAGNVGNCAKVESAIWTVSDCGSTTFTADSSAFLPLTNT
jgi:integrase